MCTRKSLLVNFFSFKPPSTRRQLETVSFWNSMLSLPCADTHHLSSVLLLLCTGLSTHACANVYSPHWGIFSTKYLTINESAHKAHTLHRQNSMILTVTSILYICSYQKICRVILSTDNHTVFTISSWCWEIGFV